MGNKKKGTEGSEDGESVEGDRRMEGIDAHVFSQPIGYIPTFPAPPKYIRVGNNTLAMKYMLANALFCRFIRTTNHSVNSIKLFLPKSLYRDRKMKTENRPQQVQRYRLVYRSTSLAQYGR